MKFTRFLLSTATTALMSLASASTFAGVVWQEQGPPGAGDSIATAQITYDNAFKTLSNITGALTSEVLVSGGVLFQVDLYKIRIADVLNFSATTITNNTAFDTQLYLFDSAGKGVYTNDDDASDSLFRSLIPTGAALTTDTYFLAIALGASVALDELSNSVFLSGNFTDVLEGDPASGPLSSWAASPFGPDEATLSYDIELTGVTNAEIPEPAGLALAMTAAACAWYGRRRQQVKPALLAHHA